ncbi:hypothetical protein B0E52_12370 [Rhodanobacter sp. C06]|nr:hypothetical protein B0E52_12370 [Rhodanobacter sp. C06]
MPSLARAAREFVARHAQIEQTQRRLCLTQAIAIGMVQRGAGHRIERTAEVLTENRMGSPILFS